MKLNNKDRAAQRSIPIRYTIMTCFLMFSLVLILLLWLFQTVFLDVFYKSIKVSQVQSAADSVANLVEKDDGDMQELSEIITKHSDMTVMIYNTTQNIYTKIYPTESGGTAYIGKQPLEGHEVYRYYKKAKENGGTATTFNSGYEYTMFAGRNDESDKLNENDSLRYPYGILSKEGFRLNMRELQSVVYAQIVAAESNEILIVIEAVITPVASTVETLRVQLVFITAILIVLSVILAFIVSRIIAAPIVKMNKNAKELARQNYEVEFSGGGYREIRELNETLNFATSELSKVETLRRELIANVSHDLRTPLTMIIGYGEVIRDLPDENTPENIQIIIDEATHLNTLVSDLMDISKLQSGAMRLEPVEFSLTSSVKDIFSRYSKLVEQRGYKILFESGGNAEVNADSVKITQVLYNLINNAVNYAGEDKTVIVRQIVGGGNVTVEVEDHGQGIEEDKLKLIWDRYYKVDKAHRSSVIGTGLGLSIVKNILDLHKAQYGVKSEVGKGSIFYFTLPCTGFEPYGEGKTTLALDKFGQITKVQSSVQSDSSMVDSDGIICEEPSGTDFSENPNCL